MSAGRLSRERASLRRIAAVSALILGVLGLGLGALVLGALRAVADERRLAHQVLAERAFDAMESELSGLLAREESRSFLQYRHVYAPEGLLPGNTALTRSPLAEIPSEPAVVGYVQLEPDGTLSTPLLPAPDAGEVVPAEVESRAAKLLALAAPLRQQGPVEAPAVAKSQAPAPPPTKKEDANRYKVEQSLNKGSTLRSERKEQVTQTGMENAIQFQSYEEQGVSLSPFSRSRLNTDVTRDKAPRNNNLKDELLPRAARSPDWGMALLPSVLDVTLSPMQATWTDGVNLILARDVVVGGERYRQGLVLDLAATQQLLERRAIGGSLLSEFATFQWAGQPSPWGDYPQHFTHDFDPPFEALQATIWLQALPAEGRSSAAYIAGLALALGVVGLLGIVAVARMVGVTVAFAERRNNFVAAVSHELKTPLTAIRMYAEMLRDDMVPSDERKHDYYEIITAESERLSRLIQNVLELARLERGSRPMNLEVGDPAPLVREVARTLAPHAADRGFTLEVDAPPALPPVRFDRDGLTQVLINLVDNAIKFSADAAEKRVIIEASASGGGVTLRVRDFGPGVPQRHMRHLFQPFYRGERELVRRTQGTGIGLALVSGLVRGMGGAVRAWNPPQGGFLVELSLGLAP